MPSHYTTGEDYLEHEKKKKKGMSTGPVTMETSRTKMKKGKANVIRSVNDMLEKKKKKKK